MMRCAAPTLARTPARALALALGLAPLLVPLGRAAARAAEPAGSHAAESAGSHAAGLDDSRTEPGSSRATDRAVSRLDRQVDRLESVAAVKRLQRAFGYYVDRALWNQAADLFAPDGTVELGADGVYVGRERVREYLERLGGGRIGLPYGRLDEHYQLQPVVHVAADGRFAKGRWFDFGLLGQFLKAADWADGIYENTYVKRDGVWMIQSMHLYVSFVAPYAKGWARLAAPSAAGAAAHAQHTLDFAGVLEQVSGSDLRSQASKAFPPDRPSSGTYRRFPQPYVPPFDYRNPGGAQVCPEAKLRGRDAQLERYEHEAVLLCDHDAIENLQDAYGYYLDANLWDEAAKLFARDATYEYGQRGVYVGRKHIRRALELLGPEGPHFGWLDTRLQLQPIIDVAPDGRTAKGRWESVMQLGRPNEDGELGLGVYENDYVKDHGVWKLSKLHFYVTALADYDRKWVNGAIPLHGPSTVLPPDRPPTEIYRSFPGVYIPPFHYRHPVTGRPIVTDPQPADSIVRPRRAAQAAARTGDVARAGEVASEADATAPSAVSQAGWSADAASSAVAPGEPRSGEQRRVEALGKRLERLADVNEVEKLQRAYGYFVDKGMWTEISQLFAVNGTYEIGGRGVFVGRKDVLRYLQVGLAPERPVEGRLINHMQYEPITTIAPDGRTAKMRMKAFVVSGYGWGDVIYENTYVKHDGVWEIESVHAPFVMYSSAAKGWGKDALVNTWPAKFPPPPDRPPTVVYLTYPSVYIVPFDYPNPVTGQPVAVAPNNKGLPELPVAGLPGGNNP
ncbi:MAG: nuclear transport factor 2 family protein [Steroidobacteraceae bacterium]